jgi:hypothetical protein
MTILLAGLLKGALSKLGLVAIMLIERLLHYLVLKLVRHLSPVWGALFEGAAVIAMFLLALGLIGWVLCDKGLVRKS